MNLKKEIILLICEGKSNIDIAEKLNKGNRTIEGYVCDLLHKLKVINREGLRIYGFLSGLYSLETALEKYTNK